LKTNKKYLIIFTWGWLAIPIFLWQCHQWDAVETAPLGMAPAPEDNPTTQAKIDLGRKLFFDKRLSRDESIACASCHLPEYAFTDRMRRSTGVGGAKTERNAPTLLNAAWLTTVMFDAHLETLEKQVTVPIQEPVEMDLSIGDLLARLRKDPEYQKAAREIYGREFDAWVLTRSIAAFQRSLISQNSRFDQYYYGKVENALTKSEIRGWKIFSEQLYCTECHTPPHFTNFQALNNGLYKEYGKDEGRFRIHHDSLDIGKFKVPTLRNITLTYPYMHNGALWELKDVIAHYSKGGAGHWNQDSRIQPFKLNATEKRDLLNFFNALTDTAYMKDFR
jgi:cytochrome c peroxidase